MNIKKKLIKDINDLEDPKILHQLWDLLQNLNRNKLSSEPNIHKILANAGTLDSIDAEEILHIIQSQFGAIEGEWN